MKVAVDARHLAGGRGVAEYTRGMLGALQDVDIERVQVDARTRRLVFASAAVLGRPRLDAIAGGADVVWAPAPAPLAVSKDVPFVLTVHDLSWVERPQDFTPYERAWHSVGRLRRQAQRADRVVVDARATIDPLTRWGVDAEGIRVVHPGVPRRPVGDLPPGTPPRYVLFVGALEPRKDPELLLRAHARSTTDAHLVFAGAGRLRPKLRGPNVHVVDAFTSEQLGALYANATALVMPSRLEGFGFPPLEAALHGTPSIVSDLPVFRETLGDACVRFPPGDEAALASVLNSISENSGDLGARAKERASSFTWGAAGASLRAVFAEVAR